LSQPLGSNIRHILEDIEMMLDDSVGLADDNMGASPKAAERGSRKGIVPDPRSGELVEGSNSDEASNSDS
jgi:hypothetical protein